jgi:hypothetical protein
VTSDEVVETTDGYLIVVERHDRNRPRLQGAHEGATMSSGLRSARRCSQQLSAFVLAQGEAGEPRTTTLTVLARRGRTQSRTCSAGLAL